MDRRGYYNGVAGGPVVVITGSPKKVVSVKLEVDLINQIDQVWKRLGYSSRSHFLREAIIFYLQYVMFLHSQLSQTGSPNGISEAGSIIGLDDAIEAG